MLRLVVVEDYHDIYMIRESIYPRVKSLEIGTTYSGPTHYLRYVGLLWDGKKPSKKEIQALLKKAKVRLNED